MKGYDVAVVGIGLVGQEILKVLRQRSFPAKSIRVLARRGRTENVAGVDYEVVPTTEDAFKGIQLAIFAGTEGEKGASTEWGWKAVEMGAVVIDNGDDFRMDPRVPLVVPEVNAEALRKHKGFISNPNCSTIQMIVALGPLHRKWGIKRIVCSSYQSASGYGRDAVVELESQVNEVPAGRKPTVSVFPHQLFGNVIPQIASLSDDFPGFYREEAKLIRETRKILDAPDMAITATCVRVPVYQGHAEAVNVEFEKEATPEAAREILANAPGVKVIDDPAKSRYPTPLDVVGIDEVLVGRIRKDPSRKNSLDLWIVGDNIKKGAALNAVQIAEKMIEMKLL